MSLIEGHAEHTMDAVGAEVLPSLPRLRAAMNRRRENRGLPWRVLERLLGLELKLRQYEVGRRFCDAVVARGGPQALARAWGGPEALPSTAELEDPRAGWRGCCPQRGAPPDGGGPLARLAADVRRRLFARAGAVGPLEQAARRSARSNARSSCYKPNRGDRAYTAFSRGATISL